MGPGQIFLTRIRLDLFFGAQVGSGQPFLVWLWVWKIFPKNPEFSNFFDLRSKNLFGLAQKVHGSKTSYLLRVKSVLGSG